MRGGLRVAQRLALWALHETAPQGSYPPSLQLAAPARVRHSKLRKVAAFGLMSYPHPLACDAAHAEHRIITATVDNFLVLQVLAYHHYHHRHRQMLSLGQPAILLGPDTGVQMHVAFYTDHSAGPGPPGICGTPYPRWAILPRLNHRDSSPSLW